MAGNAIRSFGRVALLSGAGWCAMTLAASAGMFSAAPAAPAGNDLPATAEGATALTQLFKTYVGSDPAASGLSVEPENADYLVTFDLGALFAPLAKSGVKFDSAKITMKLFAQQDGAWRVERGDMPTIVWHDEVNKTPADHAMAFTGFDSTVVYDPAIGGPRSGEFSAEKISLATHMAKVDQNFDVAGLKATTVGKAGPNDSYSATAHETVDAIGFAVASSSSIADPTSAADPKPVMVVGKTGPTVIDVTLDGWKTKPLLALEAFAVAHPTGAEMAANAGDFKALLSTLAASQPTLAETFEAQSLDVDAPQGKVSIGKIGGSLALSAKGAASHFEEHISVSGLALPESAAPAMFRDFIPTALDVGVKVSGFDVNAAAQEAITDMVVGADGNALSKADDEKVSAKLFGAGPLLIEIPPSTLVAPQINIGFEGRIQYRMGGKPTGTMTIHVHDFDKTVSALKVLGPDAEQKYVPVLAMAKGLAKTDSDGSLSWVGEIGADGVMKVNGLPLGKAPF